jgi:hypothetical protein
MNTSGPHEWSTPRKVQDIFNQEYLPRIQAGELAFNMLSNKHPSRPKAKEPYCTRSQYIEYLNEDGVPVAVVHRYLRRDGTIGASGLPDPKAVLYQGIVYYCEMYY